MMAFGPLSLLRLILLSLVVHLILLAGSSSGRSLTELYNSRVVKAERYERPLDSSVGRWILKVLRLKHSGVVVTLQNGERWLVHKGNEYGKESETVVVDAKYMGSGWRRTSSKTVRRSTVGDYVAAGGRRYSLLFDNCHHASKRMMRLN